MYSSDVFLKKNSDSVPLQFLRTLPAATCRSRSVNPDIIFVCALLFQQLFLFFFCLSQRGVASVCWWTLRLNPLFVSWSVPRRWRGALHHPRHQDDDGLLVDVRPHRHLLVHRQPSSLPHHHTHRELHTVSIMTTFLCCQWQPCWTQDLV